MKREEDYSMNQDLQELKEAYKNIEVPREGKNRMKEFINQTNENKQEDNRGSRRLAVWQKSLMAVAAALVLLVVSVNLNQNIAYAMEKLPIIGSLVRIVTSWEYESEDENSHVTIEAPAFVAEDTAAGEAQTAPIQEANEDMDAKINMLLETFEQEHQEYKDAHMGLDISYDVILDNEKYLSLRINILQTAASGNQSYYFYHYNKEENKIITLKDLFVENSDYVSVISEEILRQMKEQMAADENIIYFDKADEFGTEYFQKIDENQNFYLNEENQLVIQFDEYEVAPGYMGAPSFIIPDEVLRDMIAE